MKFILLILFWSLGLSAEPVVPATLMIEGKPVFTFRTRIGSVQPEDRVRMISERIEKLTQDRLFDLNKISARDAGELGWEVVAEDRLILVVTPQDAKLDKNPARVIAEGISLRLKEYLAEDRRMKSPREIAIHSVYALGYLIGLVFLLWTLGKLFNRGEGLLKNKIRALKIKTFEILSADKIILFCSSLLKLLRLGMTLTLLYFFVPLVLSLFPWTANLSPLLLALILNPLKSGFHAAVAFIPNVFFIVVNILITRYVLKILRLFFDEIESGNLRFATFYADWAAPTYQLVRVLVLAFAAVVIFPYIPGSNSPAFQGVSVFLGVLVSFGSSSAVSNAIAGIVLTYMRSFRTGDRVRIADTTGDIVEKTLLVTRIRTVKNVDVTIPNALVLGNHIVNFSALSKTEGLILHTEVTIGYDAPWRKVHDLLIEAAEKTPLILRSPKPFVLQTALEDSYVRYQLNAYTDQANGMAQIYSDLHHNIQDAFNAAKVEIMSPAYSAIRDGNTVTIPEAERPKDYQAPAFRFKDLSTI